MTIDFEKINAAALANLESLCCEYLTGKRKGRNFVALNPTRADGSLGSFQIHLDRGNWIDFAINDAKGGDPISLFAYIWGCSQGDSAKKLDARLNAGGLTQKAEVMSGGFGSSDSSEWEPLPYADTNDRPEFKHRVWGNPVLKTEYRDDQGRLVGYVARYEGSDGKDTIPITFCRHKKTLLCYWKWKGFATPRPLWQSDKIAAAKDGSPILIVEGEKCAESAQKLLNIIVTCWAGGTNAIDHVNFDILKRHKVFFWCDNDAPGIKCAEKLKSKYPHFEIVYPDITKPQGYDIADYIENEKWTSTEIKEFIKTRDQRKPDLIQVQEKTTEPEKPKNTETDNREPETGNYDDSESEPFVILGKDNDKNYCYYSKDDCHIHTWTATNHSKNNFMQLANWDYWSERFEGNTTAISNYLIKSCQKKGIFDTQNIRGRGVWMDNYKTLYHAGGYLFVEGKRISLDALKSKYIYEAKSNIEPETAKPLSTEHASKLIEICEMLNFSNDLDRYLLPGWIAIASICGVLPWRPHIWVTGASGSGKTWITENLVHRIVGKTALMVQGNTTEAGIRQTLQSDARPIIIDEAESQDQNAIKRMQSIMELARQASSPAGGKIIKGSASGASIEYDIRSCFYFSSIGVSAKYKADLSRISILQLKKNISPTAAKDFEELENFYKETFAHDWMADGLRARSFLLAPDIAQNAKILSEATRVILGSRGGDQYGALLAGTYSLRSDKVLTMDEAKEWISTYDWGNYIEDEHDTDEHQALSILLESIIRHEFNDGSSSARSIAELVADDTEIAQTTLARHGIRYIDGSLFVANSHEQLKKIFANTQFAEKWKDQLLRIKGAESVSGCRFGNIIKRSVKIPYSI